MTIESVPIFTVDIGNTRAKFGIWLRELCSVGFNAADAATRPAYEFADVSAGFSEAARRISELHDELNPKARWIISSVNAKKTSALLEVIRELRPKDSVKLVTIDDIPTPIRYDFPEKLGVDRVVVAYAGIRRLGSGRPFLAIDVGTAATIDYVDDDGVFCGGAILPGSRLMAEALNIKTAALPMLDDPENERLSQGSWTRVNEELDYPATETQKAIRLGLVFALVGSVSSFYWKIRRKIIEAGRDSSRLALVLAGGDAELTKFNLQNHFDDLDASQGNVAPRPEIIVEPRLALVGLKDLALLHWKSDWEDWNAKDCDKKGV